ncbi:hypothetical protein FF2_003788 [Malus domestica]
MEIRAIRRSDKSIQFFYNEMTNLWDQLVLSEPKGLNIVELYYQYREEQRLVQFLMPFQDEFETLCSSILHQTPLPSVDSVLNELQAKEVRVQSHKLSSSLSNTSALAVAIGLRPRIKTGVAMDECSICKGKGHRKSQCPKLSQQCEFSQKSPFAAVAAVVPSVLHIATDSESESRKDDWVW